MIDISNPFIAFVEAEITYDGRASSTLQRGNYLLIYKADCSFSIHGSNKIGPRNYQGSGATLEVITNPYTLVSTNKKETIRVAISSVYWSQAASLWSDHEIMITKTERELVQKIVADPSKYLGFMPDSIITEYQTSVGPVDIMATKSGHCHIVEVKRKVIVINNCVQLRKYLEVMEDAVGHVAGPGIADRALAYCGKHDLHYIAVTWN